MHRIESIIGAMIWFAAVTLMPMAALEPVQAGQAAPAAAALVR